MVPPADSGAWAAPAGRLEGIDALVEAKAERPAVRSGVCPAGRGLQRATRSVPPGATRPGAYGDAVTARPAGDLGSESRIWSSQRFPRGAALLTRLLALAVLAAAAVAACNPGGSTTPTLNLSTPSSSDMPLESSLPIESPLTSP